MGEERKWEMEMLRFLIMCVLMPLLGLVATSRPLPRARAREQSRTFENTD